jgi:protein-S-isoprenylcysteine O-methyltransferase Ste14
MNKDNTILLIYFISLAIYGIAELFLQLRFSKWRIRNRDKSYLWIMVPFYLSIYLAPVEQLRFGYAFHKVMIASGFAMLAAGVAIRMVSLLTLGKNFSVAIKYSDRSRLVVNGIYGYLRHPSYLALILISLSGCLIFNCRLDWIAVIVCLSGILLRIRKEESMLEEQYPGYVEYRRKTRKLIPYIY